MPRQTGAVAATAPGRVFDHRPHLARRFNWTSSDAEDALATIIDGADHLGTHGDGTAFLLVAIPSDLFEWLAAMGEGVADLEDNGDMEEDFCDWEPDYDNEPQAHFAPQGERPHDRPFHPPA